MLTAIYVHEPSTVTIRSTDPRERVMLQRYGARMPVRPAEGAIKLERGVYAVVSTHALQIESEGGRVTSSELTVSASKDEWPDPAITISALEVDASVSDIERFFESIVKGGDA